MNEGESIRDRLARSPGDWSLRILAVEEAVKGGDLAGAKQLVRDDPTTVPVPPEIQVRLHALLTGGILAGGSRNVGSERSIDPVPARESEEEPKAFSESVSNPAPAAESMPFVVARESGGSGALVEADEPERMARRRVSSGEARAPELRRNRSGGRFARYEGRLQLVPAEAGPLPPRASSGPDRISAVFVALIVHLVVFVLVGLVAVNVPRPKPPQLIVSVVPEEVAEITVTRMSKPSPEIKPAAAAAQALDVIASVDAATFSVPDVENADDRIVPSLLPGVAAVGTGMDFLTDTVEASDVNFFGISGSGRNLVFVIDATPKMLVDEKGGMTAYDRVKDEVGAMLSHLNRTTRFNILLYEGKQLVAFREEPVPGLPSNLRLAIEWLDPLNRDYENLGIRNGFGSSLSVSDHEEYPLRSVDVAHYTKAIQRAMEWGSSAVFCITSGYERINRTPTPEMLEEMAKNPHAPGTPGTIDPGEAERWQKAVAETRAWLDKENAARREKGISPKVVVNFNQLVTQQTGVSPPRRRGGTPASGGAAPLPAVTPEDIEEHVKQIVKWNYREIGAEEPSVHVVLFLGEDERVDAEEDHFRRLTRSNRGKLKVLRGLAALQDVTGR